MLAPNIKKIDRFSRLSLKNVGQMPLSMKSATLVKYPV